MSTAMLYVGADNDTGLLDVPRIETIMGKRHDGFTVWEATGHWKGSQEPGAVILVSDDQEKISETVADLKSELHQESIGIQQLPEIQFT
jgi:hypothetical protein